MAIATGASAYAAATSGTIPSSQNAAASAPATASAANPNDASTDAASLSDEELRARLRPVFHKFDVDGSGTVSTEEMASMLSLLEMDLTPDEVAQLMVDADPDGSGEIDFEEFYAVLSKQIREGNGGGLAQVDLA